MGVLAPSVAPSGAPSVAPSVAVVPSVVAARGVCSPSDSEEPMEKGRKEATEEWWATRDGKEEGCQGEESEGDGNQGPW